MYLSQASISSPQCLPRKSHLTTKWSSWPMESHGLSGTLIQTVWPGARTLCSRPTSIWNTSSLRGSHLPYNGHDFNFDLSQGYQVPGLANLHLFTFRLEQMRNCAKWVSIFCLSPTPGQENNNIATSFRLVMVSNFALSHPQARNITKLRTQAGRKGLALLPFLTIGPENCKTTNPFCLAMVSDFAFPHPRGANNTKFLTKYLAKEDSHFSESG